MSQTGLQTVNPGSGTAGPAAAPYYPWVDVLRGFSWIFVMLAHSGAPGCGFLGRVGLGLFYAISGWLITGILLRQKDFGADSLTHFYTRRCLRILPLYYLLLVVACCLCHWKTAIAGAAWSHDVPERKLLSRLFTFSSEYWRDGGGGLFISHCWSLCVEERFYVFWPLILGLCPRRYFARCALILVLIAAWVLTLARFPIFRPDLLDVRSIGLAALPFPMLFGAALAIVLAKKKFTLPASVATPGCLLCLYAYVRYASATKVAYGPFYAFSLIPGLLTMGIVAFAISCTAPPQALLSRLLQQLGKLSYAAYLFHIPFAFLGMKVGLRTGNAWDGSILAVVACALFASLVHRWVERPLLAARGTIEKAAWRRYLCTVLQVVPILVGLLFFLPRQRTTIARVVGTGLVLPCCLHAVLWAASTLRQLGSSPPAGSANGRDEGGADAGMATAA